MVRSHVLRQRARKGLIILSFLLFPITMNYLSPNVNIDGASQGTINGRLVAFALMFLGALFFGRLWCGWACPAGDLGEIAFNINDKKVNGKKIYPPRWPQRRPAGEAGGMGVYTRIPDRWQMARMGR